ncbi:MAG TPA: DUF2914 domain-containing protein [Thermoanaerobaculia bacterium]|jgi:hypothetical protein
MPPFARLRRYAPAVFFVAGFVWDAVTLGRAITSLDLFLLFGYLAGAAAILVAIGRGATFRGSQYLNAVLQFFFGGVFSALFIFYFLSSSSWPGYLVVAGLAALLVGNEFLESAYNELTLSWAFFALSAIMFFNFALAHLFHSISTFWFYLGTLLAVLLVVLLRRLNTRESGSVRPALGVAALMLALHAVNAIPPVPLVKKQMLLAHELHRTPSGYVAAVERRPFWRTPVFHRRGEERVYCFTSVFIPNGISTTIRHRWLFYDEHSEEWQITSVVPIRIEGGRRTGYRGYSFKQNVTPGRWRVVAESESGATIGVLTFRIERGGARTVKMLTL